MTGDFLMNAIKTAKFGSIVSSAACCAAGILLLIYSEFSAIVICRLVGALLAVGGIIKIIGYFAKDLYRLAFQFDLAFGILSLIVGLIMLINPKGFISFLHFVIGILILADGLFKIQTAVDAKRFGLNKWWLIAVISVSTCVFGFLLILNPFEGAALLMALIGVALLSEGLLNLCVAVYTVRLLKENIPENK